MTQFLQEMRKFFLTDKIVLTETNLFSSRDKRFFPQVVIFFADVLCIKQKEGTQYSLISKKIFNIQTKTVPKKIKKKHKCKTS